MEYKHFSHQHNLNLYQLQQGQQFPCSGCQTLCSSTSSVYTCWPCNFFLHDHCGNANRFIKHPSHPSHHLTLLPSPTYCSGAFSCNACSATGTAFSYSCPLCEVDLHIQCAFLPPQIHHNSHPHELTLTFDNPQKLALPQNCKVCDKLVESKYWSYCCVMCEFRVHTFCGTNEVKPGLYLDDNESQTEPLLGGGCEGSNAEQVVIEISEEEAVELFKVQLQMQMAEQLAEMLASSNISS